MGKIMVVKNKLFDKYERNKLDLHIGRLVRTLDDIHREHEWMERDAAETDTNFRQIIPYVLVLNQKQEVVLMQRMSGQGEKRLHGKHYIGAGGHVEEGHNVRYTALKECTEELGLPFSHLELQGILITDGSPVEDVHACVFYVAMTNYDRFCSPERDLHNARWVAKNALCEFVPHMEKWSQIVCRDYLKIK